MYATVSRRTAVFPSQLDDLTPTMLKKDYRDMAVVSKTDDVVSRMLSLASHRDKLQQKTSLLVEKVWSPSDVGSTEVQIAILTAKIQNYQSTGIKSCSSTSCGHTMRPSTMSAHSWVFSIPFPLSITGR